MHSLTAGEQTQQGQKSSLIKIKHCSLNQMQLSHSFPQKIIHCLHTDDFKKIIYSLLESIWNKREVSISLYTSHHLGSNTVIS